METPTRVGMIPDAWISPLAYGLAVLELVLAAGIATATARAAAAAAVLFLAGVFSGMHGYALAAGSIVPCGCAGVMVDSTAPGVHVAMLSVSLLTWLAAACVLFGAPALRAATCEPFQARSLS